MILEKSPNCRISLNPILNALGVPLSRNTGLILCCMRSIGFISILKTFLESCLINLYKYLNLFNLLSMKIQVKLQFTTWRPVFLVFVFWLTELIKVLWTSRRLTIAPDFKEEFRCGFPLGWTLRGHHTWSQFTSFSATFFKFFRLSFQTKKGGNFQSSHGLLYNEDH